MPFTLTRAEKQAAQGVECPHCERIVKLNQLIRSPYRILGCVYCYYGAQG